MAKIVILNGSCSFGFYALRFLLGEEHTSSIGRVRVIDFKTSLKQWHDWSYGAFSSLDDFHNALTASDCRVSFETYADADAFFLNPSACLAVVSGCQVLVNCFTPAELSVIKVIDLAIESGCAYVDAIDTQAAMVETLKLQERVKAGGIAAVIGCGGSPGAASLLIKLASSQLQKKHCNYSSSNLIVALGDGYDCNKSPAPKPRKRGLVQKAKKFKSDISNIAGKVIKTLNKTGKNGKPQTRYRPYSIYAGILGAVAAQKKGAIPSTFSLSAVDLLTQNVSCRRNKEWQDVRALDQVNGLFFPNIPNHWNGFCIGSPHLVTPQCTESSLTSTSVTITLSHRQYRDSLKFQKEIASGKISKELGALIIEHDDSPTESFLPLAGGIIALVHGKKNDDIHMLSGAGLNVHPSDLRNALDNNLLQAEDRQKSQKAMKKSKKDEMPDDLLNIFVSAGAPLAVFTLLLLTKIDELEPGLYFPEDLFDPLEFFTSFGGLLKPKRDYMDVVIVDLEENTDRVKKFPFQNPPAPI